MAASDVAPGLNEDFLEKILSDAKPEIKEILQDPAILNRYKQALDRLITGEDNSKLLLFLICLTSYMRKVLGAIIMGESSAGKSHLMNSVLKFFGNVEEYTRMTQASPDRIAQDFTDKILKVEELRGTEKAQSSLRVWISEGKLRLLTTARDEDGKLTTEVLETNGVPCFITTTTSIRPDEELLNRLFLISIDETEVQTRKILDYEAQQFMDPDFEEKMQPPEHLVEALEFIALAPFYEVLIPFAHDLSKKFPSKSVKARRDFKKLLYIIGSVAFLHQLQRPIVYKAKNRQYIVALPVDFLIAWEVAEQGMKETLMNIQKRSIDVLELFKNPHIEGFTSRQVATATRMHACMPPEDILGYIRSAAKGIATMENAPLLVMYYPSGTAMSPSQVSLVYVLLKQVEKANPLDVFIHSGGGDIHTAYKLVKLFKKCCSEYRALLPEYAKSAATLLAIGADKVLMSRIAELGPLDPIIKLPSGAMIPGYSIRQATKILEDEIQSCKDAEVRELKAEHILGPIAVKIDPYLLSYVSEAPKLAKQYGKRLLVSSGYKPATAERLVKKFVDLGAASHGYVIDKDEATALGLKAIEMSEDLEEKSFLLLMLLRMYNSACDRNGHPMDMPFLRVYNPKRKTKRKKAGGKPKNKK